ncbi:aldehyde dehydrogenase family protein [Halomonas llamarensis]|uniref:Aldehyde dehydrogenase n=1 Tax=Halomonas llamarensis TaxID=2945104 RepID=A0ABT0SNV1_9GAMM|nr:aldehyde dehydrogenase family protein [Halomonas llamarensis]MCL7929462.1 aldehyde dehydrogenase family protein [Halomonas llamarensis]
MPHDLQRQLQHGFDTQRQAADQAPFPNLATRRDRLMRLARMTKRHQSEIIDAIVQDFGQRSESEIRLAETSAVIHAARYARRKLRGWMRPRRASVSWRLLPARARITPQPLGVVGILSPWNYPWSLALMPAIDAIAAGNRVMLKPSEHTPATSALLAELVSRYFDPDEFYVVQGNAEIAQAFSALAFDHLLFTGSTAVGRDVAKAAAANLTPTTLELGGKSPVIVADDADLNAAAEAIIFGKGFNGGQTCIAPDYVLVEGRHLDALIHALSDTVAKQRPDARDVTTPINARHAARSTELLKEAHNHGCRVIDPGEYAPALVVDPNQDLALMQEEIFGRALPIISVKDIDAAIGYITARPHPLVLYAFTRDAALQRRLMNETRSGALVFNETLLHHAVPGLPFGGVGDSGNGAYHGRHGFERFSHRRGVFYQAKRTPIALIRPPYRRWLLKLLGY